MNLRTALLVGGGLLAGYLAYRVYKGGVQVLKTDLNPASDKNLAYRGVNGVGEALTGDKNFSLGGYIYDLFHKTYDPNAPSAGGLPKRDFLGYVKYNPAAPGDLRSDYVTAAPGAAPLYDYGLDGYLKTGTFPSLYGGVQSEQRANYYGK
ncbi:MAG: hypothetical protein NVS9B2_27890 [Steroidobacteraceae bacterium]